MKRKKWLLAIVGPTASGKTHCAATIAKVLNTEVLSADSRQFYRQMCIGTARPSDKEMMGVKHHFIGFLDISDDYRAGTFERDAIKILKDLYKTHEAVVLTGGSGLYIQLLCEGMDDIPPAEESLSDALQEELNNKGPDAMFQQLKALDPEFAKTVDRKNTRRVLRALEVCISTGQPYSRLRTGKPVARPFNIFYACLERPREELYERINRRVDRMLADGLVEEARHLYEYRNYRALNTLGYKELFDYFDGAFDLNRAVELIKRNTRRYARMQMSWWRRKKNLSYFHPDDYNGILTAFRKL